jgi:hypothetical protein
LGFHLLFLGFHLLSFGFSSFVWIINFCSFGKILIFLVCIVASLKWSSA